MKPISMLAMLLLFLGAAPAFTATYYISPTGSDSASGTSGSPFKTLSHAMSVGAGGDTYIFKNGTYNYAGSEINSSVKSGSAGAYTIVKAETDGGAIITVTDGLSMNEYSTPLQQYIQIEGLRFEGAYQKTIYGNQVKFLRCGFKSGPSSGNTVNTVVGGNNNGSNLARYILLEDCWFYGGGGRYKLLVFNAENIVLRRIVIRNDAGWNDSPNTGNPEASVAIYNSSNCEIQNVVLVDSDQNYYEFGQAFYFIHNANANPDHALQGNRIRGLIVLNTKAVGFRSDAASSTDNQLIDSVVVNSQDWAYSWGSNSNTTFTANRVAAIRRNNPFSGSSGGGFGFWSSGSVSVTNSIIANYTTGNDFDGISPTYFNSYNNGGTASGTGRITTNPATNGWMYAPRIETGSVLKTAGSGGGQIGPQIVNKIGTSGTVWGESGYNSDTGQALWPWPNEARIKSELCAGVTRGFCSDSSLTNYIWSYLGNATPGDISGGGSGDTTNPTVSLTAPANNATIFGGAVSLTASASDNVGVAGVQFKVDGNNVGAEDTSSPYSYSLDSLAVANGLHAISAVARDAAGNTTTASINVTINNPDITAPNASITAPANSATVSGNVTLSASATDDIGVVGVQFKVDDINFGTEDTSSPYSKVWSSTAIANGSHTISIVARDAAGNTDTALVTVTVNNPVPDTTLPTISLTAPANNATVSGSVTLNASASDNIGVVGVQFKVDNVNFGAEDTSSPYSRVWSSTTVANGSHTISAVARDAAGNTRTASVTVTVNNVVADITPPTISLTAPANNAAVSGAAVTASASAVDNVGVVGVQFYLDDNPMGAEDTSSPYSYSWDSTASPNGSYTVSAVARDAAGNTNTASVDVTINNIVPDTTAPSAAITAPADNATVSGSAITLSATATDNIGVVGVQFKVDNVNFGTEDTSSPYSKVWSSTSIANGSHTISIVARDAAGNTTTASITVTVNNADATAPAVSVTAPANNATVSGSVTLNASASDNFGVVGVQFKVDNVNFGAEDTSSPYSRVWSSTSIANGSHTISAVARDAAGNTNTASVTVTVNNVVADTTPPAISLTSPANNATLSGSAVSVTASASDNVSVVGVQFYLDDNPIGAEDTVAPYSYNWNSASVPNGAYSISAIARDAAGNTNTASIDVTINNADVTGPSASITAPANNATVSGTAVTLSASATDNIGVVGVQFKVDNVNSGAEDTSSPYSRVWSSTTVANGSHVISIVARDAAGNTNTASVTVTVSNAVADTTPPNASITAPANNATVSGTAVTLSASATDNVGVVGVRFKVDNVNLSSEDTSSPYSRSWNTSAIANGSHIISIVARDAAGNTTTASVTVTVNNVDSVPPTVPSSVNMTAESSTTCRIAWAPSSDNKGVSGYLLVLAYDSLFNNRVPGFDGVNIGNVTSAMLTNLDPATLYYARVYAIDTTSNLSAPSPMASAATMLPPPPTVSIANAVAVTANKVTVTWQTSSPARCILQYGLTTNYGQATELEPSYETSHSITLSDLAYKMRYHVRVLALDAMGQTTVSNDMTLETPMFSPEPGELVSSHFITPNSPGGANASAIFDPDVKHVSIYDMRGHRVFDAENTGSQSIVWTARDGSGRVLESGAYLARLTDSTNLVRSQVIVIAK